MNTKILLPALAAATLGLSACGSHDDAANNTAAADVTLNEEGLTATDNGLGYGDNAIDAAGNAALPADDALLNGSQNAAAPAGNAL